LLYARLWHKFLYDLGIFSSSSALDTSSDSAPAPTPPLSPSPGRSHICSLSEPFDQLIHPGIILGIDHEKMSKSKGNVLSIDQAIIECQGADVLRLSEMLIGDIDDVKSWSVITSQVPGIIRFRNRIYNLPIINEGINDEEPSNQLKQTMNQLIFDVSSDIETFAFNTAVNRLMKYANTLKGINGPLPKKSYEVLLLLVHPFAPFVSEECWFLLGNSSSILKEKWPEFDSQYMKMTLSSSKNKKKKKQQKES
jgi:leucyl-tRNA synthetase